MLKRKLWRDIKGNWGAYTACISVMVIGLMIYVSMALILESLEASRDKYYRQYSMADGFAQIVRGPLSLAQDIGEIKGINEVTGRIVQNVFVLKARNDDNTTIRLVSFNSDKQMLNGFKLEQGKVPQPGSREILVSPAFLKDNNYQIGSRIPLILRGNEVVFTITGTAISPEYIYEIPGGQTLTPDPKTFGVAFVPYDTVAPLLSMNGQVNDLVFTLEAGTVHRQVERPVSRILEKHGLTQVFALKDQLSNSMLAQEIAGLKATVNTTPVIFLLVAASILFIMLRRMIEQQRGQIGVLKAFGFTDWEILRHYLSYPFIIGLTGGLGGGLVGGLLSYKFAELYQQFYNIPGLSGQISLKYIAAGILLSLAFSLAAGYLGCRGVLQLVPAEAMRAPSPKDVHKTPVEKLEFFWRMLNTQGKMAVRNVFRSKQRSFLAIFGIASAFSIMVAANGSFDSINHLIDFEYNQVERYDMKIGLQNSAEQRTAISSAEAVRGILKAEPVLEVPVTLNHQWLKKDIVITGLTREGTLYQLLNNKGEVFNLPAYGLVISAQLAKTLNISASDVVTVKLFMGDKKEKLVRVVMIVPQYVGLGAYMDINALSSLISGPPLASSLLVKVDSALSADAHKTLKEGKNVSAILDKNKIKQQFEELMETSKSQKYIILIFGFVMGFAIVYNVNIISLSEREREMATLTVLGMTEGEINRILVFEQLVLGVTAVVVGIPLSYGMLWAIVSASGNDIYNMPLVISGSTIATGILWTLMFLIAAQWKMKGRIRKLSMLDVLKQQD
ncbi:MAG: FtsX-like permease family protein [Thermincola sp.]|jgi:putative ABC transport system permease protein|nr:FtsX-like permease family protein [Thermincola sp.]MDT3702726.1 FtsX-like permease family protein [Thermincola sp.]